MRVSLLAAALLAAAVAAAAARPAAASEHAAELSGEWFEQLSERELAAKFSHDDGGTLAEKMAALQRDFETSVAVEVVLVGFDGDGNGAMRLTREEVAKYFAAAAPQTRTGALGPGAPRELPFRTRVVHRVTKAPRSLARALSAEVRRVAAARENHAEEPAKGFMLSVPLEAVDRLVAAEFAKSSHGYTLYVLNLARPRAGDMRRTELPYAYLPPSPGLAAGGRGRGAAPCHVAHWAGEHDQRYAWVDLSAGPLLYGPATSGGGIVSDFSFPSLGRESGAALVAASGGGGDDDDDDDDDDGTAAGGASRRPFTASPEADEQRRRNEAKHGFLAELVAMTARTTEALVTPPAGAFPVPFRETLVVNVMLITDEVNAAPMVRDAHGVVAGWGEVAAELRALALHGQRVEVVTHRISFHECELCAAALTHSRKTHTSNVLTDSLRTQVHGYLDSREMRDWMEHFEQGYWGLKSATLDGVLGTERAREAQKSGRARVVNAFVFDLVTRDLLLLDRFHQAVAFDDMVLAVQTRSPPAVLDYSCGGLPVQFDPRDCARATLGGLLQAGWGVAPSDVRWNAVRNASEPSHLWAVGHTPFGYFSGSSRLSFAHRDAAARHVLLSDVNATMAQLAHVLGHFSSYERELAEVQTPAEHLSFVRRYNVFTHKLDKAAQFASVGNFQRALFYMRSAHHDIDAMHKLVHAATESLRPVIECQRDASPAAGLTRGGRLALLAAAVLVFVALLRQTLPDSWLRRARSKRHYY